MNLLGIDVGGTGIKGAIINTVTGQLVTDRKRLSTPQPANPQLIIENIVELIRFFDWKKEIGCGFPSVIKKERSRKGQFKFIASKLSLSYLFVFKIDSNAHETFKKLPSDPEKQHISLGNPDSHQKLAIS